MIEVTFAENVDCACGDCLERLITDRLAADLPLVLPVKPVEFVYRNWRDVVSRRHVVPIRIWFGTTGFHPDQQWFLRAYDLEKAEYRDFAFSDISPQAAPRSIRQRFANFLNDLREEL